MKTWIVFLTLGLMISTSFAADMTDQTMVDKTMSDKVVTDKTNVMTDIRSTLGMVPTFMKEFPPEGLPGAWEEFKGVQLNPNTALDGKTKELIGLAVASQIPCRYCVYYHKKSATFFGAKPSELKMAISISANTRKWSTHFYGSQQDLTRFKSEIDKIVSTIKNPKPSMMKGTVTVTDAASAYKDMENTFGFVPDFMKSYPESGVMGAWNEFKGLEMNPGTVLPPKVKDLISLAVSSQVPCQYCTYADTEFAKMDGASDQEIKETIAVAGIVRHWSTFLNGLRQDDKAFEREVDQIFRHLERNKNLAPKKVSLQGE